MKTEEEIIQECDILIKDIINTEKHGEAFTATLLLNMSMYPSKHLTPDYIKSMGRVFKIKIFYINRILKMFPD